MENQKRTPFSGLASACSAVWDKTWPWMKLDGREQRLFCLLFSLHFLYLLPLILAGDYYRDDFARSLNGGFGWKELGRPGADLFMHFLSFGTPIRDVAPLTQLFGLALLAYTMVLLARRYFANVPLLLLVLCLGLTVTTPALLQSFSYRFDSGFMLLALCLPLLCYALPDEVGRRYRIVFGTLACFVSLGCYQAGAGAFIAMAFVEMVFINGTRQETRARLVERAETFALAGVLYVAMLLCIPLGIADYGADHAQILRPWTEEGIWTIRQNLQMFRHLLNIGFHAMPLPALLGLGLLLFHGFLESHKTGRGLRFIIAYIGIIFGAILPQMPLAVTVNEQRTVCSYAVLAIFYGILASRMLCTWRKAAVSVLVLVLLGGFSLSYTYGNILHHQTAQQAAIARMITDDLGRIDPNVEKKNVTILGTAPISAELRLERFQVRLIKENLLIYLDNDYNRGFELMWHASARPIHRKVADESDRIVSEETTPVFRRDIYAIYENGDTYVVKFLQP